MGAPRLLATICTNREPEQVREPLAAAAAQAAALGNAEALLVTSGLDEGPHAGLEVLAARLGARSLRAGPGLSTARNAALADVTDEDVLAFLDDDAIPHTDWLERLAARWAEAPADVACIGGAIEPRWGAEPPEWVSEGIWTSFSLLDRGEGVAELHPSRGEDVWGANVSFRAGPLRRVGGFDVARGPWPGVPLFGDESDAQRRLENAGHRILYAGDVRVEHLIGPERLTLGSLARRERWRGVSAAASGHRSPAGGVPRAFKAAAGLAVAGAARDRPLAGERWARMWRELGIAGMPLARRRLRRRGWPG